MDQNRKLSRERRNRGSRIRAQKKKEVLEKRIVNLSSLQLSASETSLLQKGLNFCPTPSRPDIEELDKDINAFVRRLYLKLYLAPEDLNDIENETPYQPSTLEKLNKKEKKDNRPPRESHLNSYAKKLRQDIKDNIFQDSRRIWKNLSVRERAALNRLSRNTDIVIKPADKGGATVAMNTTDYLKEAMRQLQNEDHYKKTEKDLTSDHEQSINQLIDQLLQDGELNKKRGELLKSIKSRTPVFHTLPKIHKPNNPGRPVVSSVQSHTEKLSAYVDEFLRPTAENLPSHIKDTTDFILRLKNLGQLPKGCFMVTHDVSSLYTNIDTSEGLKIVKEEVQKNGQLKPSAETITLLLEKVLRMNNFILMIKTICKPKEQRWAQGQR